jgi:hypothetical protein
MNEEVTQELNTPSENAPAEKLFTQDHVRNIVAKEVSIAAQKARREVEEQYQSQAQNQSNQQQASQMGGMSQPNMDDMYQQFQARLQEEAAKKAYEDQIRRVADTYVNKMATGAELFEDFNDVMGEFDPARFPSVVYLVSEMENVPQIMYELANNPMKLASINSLAQTDERQAKKALQMLSKSIAHNENAKEEYVSTNAPLSKLKPSNVSADKGLSTLEDFKNASWLRG